MPDGGLRERCPQRDRQPVAQPERHLVEPEHTQPEPEHAQPEPEHAQPGHQHGHQYGHQPGDDSYRRAIDSKRHLGRFPGGEQRVGH